MKEKADRVAATATVGVVHFEFGLAFVRRSSRWHLESETLVIPDFGTFHRVLLSFIHSFQLFVRHFQTYFSDNRNEVRGRWSMSCVTSTWLNFTPLGNCVAEEGKM